MLNQVANTVAARIIIGLLQTKSILCHCTFLLAHMERRVEEGTQEGELLLSELEAIDGRPVRSHDAQEAHAQL